jgi:hypothetical protein
MQAGDLLCGPHTGAFHEQLARKYRLLHRHPQHAERIRFDAWGGVAPSRSSYTNRNENGAGHYGDDRTGGIRFCMLGNPYKPQSAVS